MKILGGMVSFGHGKKDDPNDQYSQSKKAIVELRFDVAEDGDANAMLNHASALAQAKVNEMCGIKSAVKPSAQTVAPSAGAQAGAVKTESPPPAPATPSKPRGRPKAEPKAADPDEIGGDVAGAQPEKAIDALGTDVDEFVVEPVPVAKQIADSDLTGACGRKSTDLGTGGSVKIREWIAKFRTDQTKTFQVADIPQARRQEFLDGLKALS